MDYILQMTFSIAFSWLKIILLLIKISLKFVPKGPINNILYFRSWDGWLSNKLGQYEMIVPDVSRVYRRPYEGLSGQADFLTELFNRQRITNLWVSAIFNFPQYIHVPFYI